MEHFQLRLQVVDTMESEIVKDIKAVHNITNEFTVVMYYGDYYWDIP